MRLVSIGLIVLIASGCRSAGARPAVSPDTGKLAITHATVITGDLTPPLRNATVLVQGTRIVAIDTGGGARPIPSGATRIDGTGKYLIPGLWDMHVHLVLEGRDALPAYVRRGVTGVRDMGGELGVIRQYRSEIATGAVVGPRILSSGPALESPASIKGILETASKPESARASLDRVLVPDVRAANKAIDSLAALGVDFIKSRSYASNDVYWAIASGARSHGLRFAGHAPFELVIDPMAFADSGNESLEHWYYPLDLMKLPDSTYQRVIAAFARRHTAMVPTLGAWRQHRFTYDSLRVALERVQGQISPWLLAHWRTELEQRRTEHNGKPYTAEELAGWNRVLNEFSRDVGRLHADGMPVLPGSDLPFATLPGEALQNELGYLVREAGMSPQQVIQAATLESARWLRLDDSLGTVAAGKVADLVILDADPLADIDNIRRVNGVVLRGKWLAASTR